MSYRLVDSFGDDAHTRTTRSFVDQKEAKTQALLAYVADEDWHGVRDVAVELEIMAAMDDEDEEPSDD